MRLYVRKNIIYLDFAVNNKRKRPSTGLENTPKNRKLIEKEIIPQIQLSIAKGEYHPGKDKIMPTVEDFGYKSLKLHRHERSKNVNIAYKLSFELHILPYFKNTLLKQITPIDLHEWQNTIVDKTSASSLRTYRNIFRIIFVDAALEGHIKSNPFDKIKRPIVKDAEIIPFTKSEIESIIKTASIKFRNFFIISVFTGIRTGELIALEWEDIDYEYKEIRINKTRSRGENGPPKTKSSIRTIDMLPIVEKYLKEQYKLTGHKKNIFTNSAGNIYFSSDTLNISLKRILDRCNIKTRTLYNTRHTFASLMLTNNESIMWVSQTLGHKTANITFEKYARYIKEDKTNRAKFLDKWHIFDTRDNPTRLKVRKQGVE